MLLNVLLDKIFYSPLDCKEIQPVHLKGNQSWIFIGRTDAVAEALMLWPPDVKNWLIWKDCDAGKDWRWEEKGMTEDEMVGWHHQLNGHEFESTLGVGDGQGGLACCSPWDCKELDTTEWLNWTEVKGRWLRAKEAVFSLVLTWFERDWRTLPDLYGLERISHSVLSGNSEKTWSWIKIKNAGVKKDRDKIDWGWSLDSVNCGCQPKFLKILLKKIVKKRL